MLTNAPKGTKDILPQQTYQWQYVERIFDQICGSYGFKEIRTPVFEHTELFTRGVGGTTDIVEKQMYTFDDLGKRSITLKPEGTSPAVRAFLESKTYAQMQPTKLYYCTPCFRYEKPQAGRLREFHQFGTEVLGSNVPLADAEIIGLATEFLNVLQIKELELRINSVGCPTCRAEHRKALKEFLAPKHDALCDTCKNRYERNPMRILDCKSSQCQKLIQGAPLMLEYLCSDCKDHFEQLQVCLKAMNISFIVDPMIVRGLDYYTKTAFEIVSNHIGAQGTVCGGGRYDNLAEELGGPSIPGVGFGLGIERLLLVMENMGVEIPRDDIADYVVVTMGEKAFLYGISLTAKLRKSGKIVEMDLMKRSMKNQFKFADKIKAKSAIIIGDDELEKGIVVVRNMETGEQEEVEAEKWEI